MKEIYWQNKQKFVDDTRQLQKSVPFVQGDQGSKFCVDGEIGRESPEINMAVI
jgi:hypothetical protein